MRIALSCSVGLAAVLSACSNVRQLPSGAYRATCPDHLDECRLEAENHCLGRGGVEEVSAQEVDQLYGVEGAQRGVLMSEVIFYCGDNAPRKPIALPARPAAVTSAAGDSSEDPEVVTAGARSAVRPGKNRRVCIPGSTQRCVGPGACVGSQICAKEGLAWGACDCGPLPNVSASATAPMTSATSTAPAAPPTASATLPGPSVAGSAALPISTR
ncbi:MAG: hypothetical protein JW751_06200 [Polyangiaceae bacterium]|nr:hypothetical protein [Polyangiaceae bacterium]